MNPITDYRPFEPIDSSWPTDVQRRCAQINRAERRKLNRRKHDNDTHHLPAIYRTVKVKDDLHHKLRLKAIENRMPLQLLIEELLESGLRKITEISC
jgi:hypothetical protein